MESKWSAKIVIFSIAVGALDGGWQKVDSVILYLRFIKPVAQTYFVHLIGYHSLLIF